MNVNFGLFPDLPPPGAKMKKIKGADRKQAMSERALAELDRWLGRVADTAAQ
jgi:folate-dependent tRNA-U54 methylase TrmFO/GidA